LRLIETCAGLCAVGKVFVKFCFTKDVGERKTMHHIDSTLCHVSAPSMKKKDRKHDMCAMKQVVNFPISCVKSRLMSLHTGDDLLDV
jgi:hypothetical protein